MPNVPLWMQYATLTYAILQKHSYSGGGWYSSEGRWSMSQPERKLVRVRRPPLDVRIEHQKKIAHLTVAERESLRQSLEEKYQVFNHRALKQWKKSGYDPSKKKSFDQFNIKNGWFWDYPQNVCSNVLLKPSAPPPVHLSVPTFIVCLLQAISTSGNLYTPAKCETALCLPPLATTAGETGHDAPG